MDNCPDCIESYGHRRCKGACYADALRAAQTPYANDLNQPTAPAVDDWLTIGEKHHAN